MSAFVAQLIACGADQRAAQLPTDDSSVKSDSGAQPNSQRGRIDGSTSVRLDGSVDSRLDSSLSVVDSLAVVDSFVEPLSPTCGFSAPLLAAGSYALSCNVNGQACLPAVAADTAFKKVGNASLYFHCSTCGNDTSLELKSIESINKDLSAYNAFSFWVYSNTLDMAKWQSDNTGNNPWIVFRDNNDNSLRIEVPDANSDWLNNYAYNQWGEYVVPIGFDLQNPPANWTVKVVGAFSWTKVNSIKITVDPWGDVFSIWFDHFRMSGPNGASCQFYED